MNDLKETSQYIFKHLGFHGKTAVILGSGLGGFTDILTDHCTLPYENIPHYPKSTVKGHSGKLVKGMLEEKEILVAKGRVHCYEGYSRKTVTFPIRVFKELGIENLIITNSSGSLKRKNTPGTLMVIEGHMDFTFQDGTADPSLISDGKFHSPELISIAKKVASINRIHLATGNYCWTLGPAYETPAEIQYFKSLNGTAVGMSTLPEIEEGGTLGLNVLTLSTLTNFAAGISEHPLTHKEVLHNAEKEKGRFLKLLSGIIERI